MEIQQIPLSEDDVLRSYFLPAVISIITAFYTICFSVSNLERKKITFSQMQPSMNMCTARFIQKHTSRVIVPQVFSFFTQEYKKGRPSGMKETRELITT